MSWYGEQIATDRLIDHRGRELTIERGHITIRDGGILGPVISEDPMDGPVIERRRTRFVTMIDGEPASKRRVGQFIRRAREHMEKEETE